MERILIKFTKLNSAKFISHLDTMRTLHRALRRAEIPVYYSKGFNPHASISVAAPLSLGISSTAEYADIETDEFVDQDTIKEKLNKALPEGIKILATINITQKMPSSMGSVDGAKYMIKLEHNIGKQEATEIINGILESKDIFVNKRTKSGEKLVDIRPLIESIQLISFDENQVTLEALLHTGSKGSLGPEILSEILKERSEGKIYGYPHIERTEIYSMSNNKWVALLEYFSGK